MRLPILDVDGAQIPLFAGTGPKAPLVDKRCRVMDSRGNPIAGLFGIGLAAGFVPHGKLGGEPSFVGQANGLWLWQNDIGSIIVEGSPAAAIGYTRIAAAWSQDPFANSWTTAPAGTGIALASGTGD